MNPRISSATRVVALLGDPVSHSLSPVIQNAAFAVAGVDGVYVALHCGSRQLSSLMAAVAHAGGCGNVTLPHKEGAAAAVELRSETVRKTGACNTFWSDRGKLRGDNTDVEGFSRAVERFLGRRPKGQRVLLLGAGGAARGVLLSLLNDGVSEVTLYNRTVDRARAVSRRIGGKRVRVASTAKDVYDERFDLVVNATRLSLDDADPLPLELSRLAHVGAVMDLVYGKEETRFVKAARAFGVPATDGGEMLVQQGAVAFERWWGRDAPVDAMRTALDAERRG